MNEITSREQAAQYFLKPDTDESKIRAAYPDLFDKVTVKCGNEVRSIFKGTLIAHNKKFESMISKMTLIFLCEFHPWVAKDFLNFLEKGKSEGALETLELSLEHDLPILTEACLPRVKRLLNICNVNHIFHLCETYDLKDLDLATRKLVSNDYRYIPLRDFHKAAERIGKVWIKGPIENRRYVHLNDLLRFAGEHNDMDLANYCAWYILVKKKFDLKTLHEVATEHNNDHMKWLHLWVATLLAGKSRSILSNAKYCHTSFCSDIFLNCESAEKFASYFNHSPDHFKLAWNCANSRITILFRENGLRMVEFSPISPNSVLLQIPLLQGFVFRSYYENNQEKVDSIAADFPNIEALEIDGCSIIIPEVWCRNVKSISIKYLHGTKKLSLPNAEEVTWGYGDLEEVDAPKVVHLKKL